jgi:hypothetical protein
MWIVSLHGIEAPHTVLRYSSTCMHVPSTWMHVLEYGPESWSTAAPSTMNKPNQETQT